jgi:hypothetical protein
MQSLGAGALISPYDAVPFELLGKKPSHLAHPTQLVLSVILGVGQRPAKPSHPAYPTQPLPFVMFGVRDSGRRQALSGARHRHKPTCAPDIV